MSSHVSGGVDVLKFWEKQWLSKFALDAGDKQGDPLLLMSVWMELTLPLRLLITFQKFLWEGLRAAKNLFLCSKFFGYSIPQFLYLGIKVAYSLDLLNRVSLFFISWTIFLDNHGRFLLLGGDVDVARRSPPWDSCSTGKPVATSTSPTETRLGSRQTQVPPRTSTTTTSTSYNGASLTPPLHA